jgi:hypothetical protein
MSGCGNSSITSDTGGLSFTCTATSAGGTRSETVSIKRDATPPSAALFIKAGTSGSNGWYTSGVTIGTTGTDGLSGPVTCTGDQQQTEETSGASFGGSCTNGAGLSTDAAPLTVKVDKSGPSAVMAVVSGTAGSNGWYTSDVTIGTSGEDSVSGPVTCTGDQHQTQDTSGASFGGSCANNAGLSTVASPLNIRVDKTAPVINISTPEGSYVLNSTVTSSYSCSDATSGIAGCNGPADSGSSLDTGTVGTKSFTVAATDAAGNHATLTRSYAVQYATGVACMDGPRHAILQPINPDGSSVFKQKSTVPAKFRVCDARGESMSASEVVSSFRLVQKMVGTMTEVDEMVVSTTPDTSFRWDPVARQWIFNIGTRNLISNAIYYYRITLNDATTIDFQFGLK